jgi:FkbM family methyltransferase
MRGQREIRAAAQHPRAKSGHTTQRCSDEEAGCGAIWNRPPRPVRGVPALSSTAKLARFARTARALGADAPGAARILWALSKNARVALGLARHDPASTYALATTLGPVHLRDNFGDVTNLPGLLVENTYRVTQLDRPGEILDVGANIGLFAKWIRAHNPGRRIHCFEPLAGNAALAQQNCPDAIVNRLGVGRAPARVQASVDRYGMMASSVGQKWELVPYEFDVIPLDDYARQQGISEVAYFKLDTEGMELDVIAGAKWVLERTHRVGMETHGDERHRASIAELRALGFTIDAEERAGAVGMVWASRK